MLTKTGIAGKEVTFEGNALFDYSLRGETVYLRSIADSCIGDEIMTDYCRVKESDEGNNKSPLVEVYLPYFEENYTPLVEVTTISLG